MGIPGLAVAVAAFPGLALAAQGFEYHIPQVKGIAAAPSTLAQPGTKTEVYCRIGNAGTKVLSYGSKELQALQTSSYELQGELSFNGQKVSFKIPPVLPGTEVKSPKFITWTPSESELGKELAAQCRLGAGTPYDSQAQGALKVGHPLKGGTDPAGSLKLAQDKPPGVPPGAGAQADRSPGTGGAIPAPGTAGAVNPKAGETVVRQPAKVPAPPHSWEGSYDSLDNVPKATILQPANYTHFAVDIETGTAWQTKIPVRVTVDPAYIKQKLAKSPQAKLYVSYGFLWCPKEGSSAGCKTSGMGFTQEWPLAAGATHHDRTFSALDLFTAVGNNAALGTWKISAMVTSGPNAPGHISDVVTLYLDSKVNTAWPDRSQSAGDRSGKSNSAPAAAPAARQAAPSRSAPLAPAAAAPSQSAVPAARVPTTAPATGAATPAAVQAPPARSAPATAPTRQ